MRTRLTGLSLLVVASLGLLSGCQTEIKSVQPTPTNRRSVSAELNNALIGKPAVKDFLAVCDLMARDLIQSTVVQTAARPIVIEIRPVENKTNTAMDLTIYPQTIRGMIMKRGCPQIAFRDESALKDVIRERANQSDDPITVEDETESSSIDSIDTLGGVGMPTPKAARDTTRTKTSRRTKVSGKTADVDYFLKGFIYATNETATEQTSRGFRYYQFQFRLTDAQSRILVWENYYRVKLAGDLGEPPG